MARSIQAGIGDGESPVLLRSQGCFLPRWSSQWLIGDLSLSAGCFAFAQADRHRFELPLARITGLAVKQRKFVLLRKEVVQLTYALPDKEREKQVWFIAPDLRRWIEKLETLTGAREEPCVRPVGRTFRPLSAPLRSPVVSPPQMVVEGGRGGEPVRVREDQVRELAATVGAPGARVLWYLWQERHADIEELAALIDAPTHMDVLTLLRERINAPACRLLGGPVLVFKERAFDPDTGRTICFQWWLERDEEVGEQSSAQPQVEIHDEGEALLVVATVPWASEVAPRALVRGRRLVLATDAADAPWELAVPLPCRVLPIPTSFTFSNGVMSLWLAKKAQEGQGVKR